MKETIYTIPVNDAFDSDCECPICSMYKTLEDDALEFAMGSSYMEDDIRAMTDRLGFCQKHLVGIYEQENRLGFALVMKTHLDRVIDKMEKHTEVKPGGRGFLKKADKPEITAYAEKIGGRCFICNRIDSTFARYLDTVLQMYKKDSTFKEKYSGCKGFCTKHYGMLIEKGTNTLKGAELDEFVEITNRLYLDNMKRVRDDVEWFINKFDHNYMDAPWKNAKDSLQRAMIKDGSYIKTEKKKK